MSDMLKGDIVGPTFLFQRFDMSTGRQSEAADWVVREDIYLFLGHFSDLCGLSRLSMAGC